VYGIGFTPFEGWGHTNLLGLFTHWLGMVKSGAWDVDERGVVRESRCGGDGGAVCVAYAKVLSNVVIWLLAMRSGLDRSVETILVCLLVVRLRRYLSGTGSRYLSVSRQPPRAMVAGCLVIRREQEDRRLILFVASLTVLEKLDDESRGRGYSQIGREQVQPWPLGPGEEFVHKAVCDTQC